jgi:ATP-dependent Clp protease protease subunit
MPKSKDREISVEQSDPMMEAIRSLTGNISNRIFITGEITSESMADACRVLLDMNEMDEIEEIVMFINSPGGDISGAFALIDIMLKIKKPITTIGLGIIGSAAIPILANGTKGRSLIGENSLVFFHQPSYTYGDNTKINVTNSEVIQISLNRVREMYVSLTSRFCNKTQTSQISKLVTDVREITFPASEAKRLGIVDNFYGGL